MKESKILIPILILTLLLACLAATFAWFSSLENMEIGGNINIALNHDVVFSPSQEDILKDADKYMGQEGYNEAGDIYTGAEAPYEFNFDVDLKAQASTDANLMFGCQYILIRIPNENNQFGKSYEEIATALLHDSDPVLVGGETKEQYYQNTYGATMQEVDIDSSLHFYKKKGGNEAGEKDKLEEVTTGKMLQFMPINSEKNKDKPFMIHRIQGGVAPKYTTIILKPEYCTDYFDLTYLRKEDTPVKQQEGETPIEPIYSSFDDPLRLYHAKGETGVIEQIAPMKFNIHVRFCSVDKTKEKPYGPFIFANDICQKAEFRFMFKFSLREA